MPSNDVSSMAQLAGGVLLGGYTLMSLSGRRNSSSSKDPRTKSKEEAENPTKPQEDYMSVKSSYSNVDDAQFAHKAIDRVFSGTSSTSSFDFGSQGVLNDSDLRTEVESVAQTVGGRSCTLGEAATLVSTLTKVAVQHSDLVFSFCSPAEISQSDSSEICFLENRLGNGSVVVGALSAGSNASVILSSESVKLLLPSVFEINALKLKQKAVFHVACRGVDLVSLQLFSDYSCAFHLANAGFSVFLPSDNMEAEGYARFIHSRDDKKLTNCGGYANCFDGLSGFNTVTNLKAIETESKGYKFFEYYGSEEAVTVVIVYGSAVDAVKQAVKLLKRKESVAILAVKQLGPMWSDEEFAGALPKSVKRICVLDYNTALLFKEIAVALTVCNRGNMQLFSAVVDMKAIVSVDPTVAAFVVANVLAPRPDVKLVLNKEKLEKLSSKYSLITSFATKKRSLAPNFDEIIFWNYDVNISGFAEGTSFEVTTTKDSDCTKTTLRLAKENHKAFPPYAVKEAGMVVCEAASVTSEVTASVRRQGKLLLVGKRGAIGTISDELKGLLERQEVTVFLLDSDNREVILSTALAHCQNLDEVVDFFDTSISSLEEDELYKAGGNTFVPRLDALSVKSPLEPKSQGKEVSPTQKLAWSLLFKDAYQSSKELRPSDHDVSTAIVTKFERLTPSDYSRNIFHIEFDISNTGIKYEIGDALGVFGENDTVEVDKFISEYGLNPEEFVRLPTRGKMRPSSVEFVSVRNLLLKFIDLFGKVSKKFYVELARFATKRYEYLKLMHTGTDDAEWFKLGTYETVTYAELLLQYRSCKLSINDIMTLVPEIKARHYSISSSMKLNPRAVHLLVVAVDWVTPLGKRGQGQCTRYLKGLKVGQRVAVDIQKSVLRLPPDPKQPIVMAGLGTGMAPFRAFIQQRYWMLKNGLEIGPMVLYFGARHKREEWLYGEELEKYAELGLLRLGLAWSRDQEHKVYIQHKIKEDSMVLKEYLKEKNGYFYLCGPTWPVPDVRDALASGLDPEKNEGKDEGELDVQVVEDMKDEGRYILEVY